MLVTNCQFSVYSGWELSGEGGVEPLPQFTSTEQTHVFEWKSALNFNPWAKFQTFRHLTPLPPVLFAVRSIPTLRVLTCSSCHSWQIPRIMSDMDKRLDGTTRRWLSLTSHLAVWSQYTIVKKSGLQVSTVTEITRDVRPCLHVLMWIRRRMIVRAVYSGKAMSSLGRYALRRHAPPSVSDALDRVRLTSALSTSLRFQRCTCAVLWRHPLPKIGSVSVGIKTAVSVSV